MTASTAIPQGATGVPDATPAPADEEPRGRRRKFLLLFLLLGALTVLLLLAIWYLLFREPIRNVLPIVPDQSLPGYSTSMYGVDRPYGVAVTAGGDRVYATQTNGAYGVVMFDGGGNPIGTFDTPPGPSHVPVYLALNPVTQEVYVSDRPAGAVWVYDGGGHYLRQFAPAVPIKGWQPVGIAFDTAGNLYVTDFGAQPQVVEEFDKDGTLVRTIGSGDGLSFPNGVAVDDAGIVYVTDGDNGRLLAYGTDGSIVARVGRGVGDGNLGLPRGVVVAKDRVYVADSTGQTVFVYGVVKPGENRLPFIGAFGGQGISNGQFQFPNDVAVDGRGRLYVADAGNDRVQVWSY
jgi:DNA-binding beta-propeller fold protein YncE